MGFVYPLAVDMVAGVLQRGYGDATQTALDRRVAEQILDALSEAGWADPLTLRAIVASAGGLIDVSDQHLADPPDILRVDPVCGAAGVAYRVSTVQRAFS